MKGLRIVAVAFIAVLELAGLVTTLITFEWPVAEFGYNVGSDGVTIVSVEPGLRLREPGWPPATVSSTKAFRDSDA